MKRIQTSKKYFWFGSFWLKYIFRIKFKIPILDLMLLPKSSIPFEGLYSSSRIYQHIISEHCVCSIRFQRTQTTFSRSKQISATDENSSLSWSILSAITKVHQQMLKLTTVVLNNLKIFRCSY